MKLEIRTIDDLAAALELAARLDRCADESLSEFRDEPLPSGTSARLLERRFGAPETLLVVAADSASDALVGLCLTAPLEDPLTCEVSPVIVVLHVEPDMRHRGVAGALVGEARRALARRGIPRLAARVGYNDDALISMGERWGFVRQWDLMQRE